VPTRRHARPSRAPTPTPSSFLPPQPLADRDRRFRFGRRSLVAIAVVVGLTLAVPLAFAKLGPVGGPLQPLAGGVAGAVSASHQPTATASPASSGARSRMTAARLRPPTSVDQVSAAAAAISMLLPTVPVVGNWGLTHVVFRLSVVALYVFLIVKALQGERYRLPVLGDLADKLSS